MVAYIFPNTKIFSTGNVAEPWNRMTREVFQLQILEVFERGTDMAIKFLMLINR